MGNCDRCGAEFDTTACKAVCHNCGRMIDCSDGGLP